MKTFLSIIFLSFFSVFAARSQNFTLSGKIRDAVTNQSLVGANIILSSIADSTKRTGTNSDNNGYFRIQNLSSGRYIMKVTYLGYKKIEKNIFIRNDDNDLGVIKMESSTLNMTEVVIEGKQTTTQVKGDTTEYNTNAYKTTKDASTEDLVKKLPGVTVENGTVKAQGEEVKKVLIDGQEIFGDDPTITLRNMPSEIVDKIQVFDKLSDQSQFTGFDDGNSQKTMNIITKNGKNKGQFGKIYAGYGTDDRYIAGGNLNYFKDKRRISLIGLSNNTNQQNFSSQDLLGVTGSTNVMRGPSGPSGRQSRGGPPSGGGSDAGNFLIGQQGGINTTQSLGLNYIDVWSKKATVNFSYFFNKSGNTTQTVLHRQYFLKDTSSQFYDETSASESRNFNHRFSLRIQYDFDSSNSLIIQPKFNLQDNSSSNSLSGINFMQANQLLSETTNDLHSIVSGYNLSNNLLYRHKFKKAGRTISLNISNTYKDKSGETNLISRSWFYETVDSSYLYDQRTNTSSSGNVISPSINYTEPLGKNSLLQFSYNPSFSKNTSNKETNKIDTLGEYLIMDTALTNHFVNKTTIQRSGISYRLKGTKYNFTAGLNYQNTLLTSDETFPLIAQTKKSYDNLLPSMMLQYKFSKSSNLRVFYRTSTNAPDISQLQNVINYSNPLFLSSGNPDLKQEYSHSLTLRYGLTNSVKTRMFFAFASAGLTNNNIGNATIIAKADSILERGIILNKGSQLSIPVNLSGSRYLRSFFTYGLPVRFLKSNLNLNAGMSFNRTPALINNVINLSQTYNFNGGFVLGSNISEKVDFTISYSGYYNMADNSMQPEMSNNYFYHIASFKLNWIIWKGLVVSSDLANNLYSGLGETYDKSIYMWNAGIGYKFLKNEAAELRLTCYDILNQNKSISRTVNESYIEDNNTNVLKQYYMIIFTYNLRNFKHNVKK